MKNIGYGPTMTVGELIEKLMGFPPDLPVLATWEGIFTAIQPDEISVGKPTEPTDEPGTERDEALIINVD